MRSIDIGTASAFADGTEGPYGSSKLECMTVLQAGVWRYCGTVLSWSMTALSSSVCWYCRLAYKLVEMACLDNVPNKRALVQHTQVVQIYPNSNTLHKSTPEI